MSGVFGCSGWNSWSGYGAAFWGWARGVLPASALVGLTVFAAVGFGSYYLSRPDFETLYIGLNAQDVSRIGAALKEAGITFDVNSQGNAVSVRRGQTAQARMLLAEKGLPTQRQCGLRAVRQDGLDGPHVLHAGDHAACGRWKARSRAPSRP